MRGQRGWRELAALGDKINKLSCKIEGLIYAPRCGISQNQADEWASEVVSNYIQSKYATLVVASSEVN